METENIIENIKASMVLVSGSTFIIGDRIGLNKSYFLSRNIDPVKMELSDFHICNHTVTRLEWYAVMNNDYDCKDPYLPVTNVSWHDTLLFINQLNKISGWSFRLPTEAEWEYAARGGEYDKNEIFSGGNILNNNGWFKNNSNRKIHNVMEKNPNILGLFDMSGNVREWCQDWYYVYYEKGERIGFFSRERYPVSNPQGPMDGKYRVVRGGSFSCKERECWVFFRGWGNPNSYSNDIGFRICC